MQSTCIIPRSQVVLVRVTSNATVLLHKTVRVRHVNCHCKRYISVDHIDEIENERAVARPVRDIN